MIIPKSTVVAKMWLISWPRIPRFLTSRWRCRCLGTRLNKVWPTHVIFRHLLCRVILTMSTPSVSDASLLATVKALSFDAQIHPADRCCLIQSLFFPAKALGAADVAHDNVPDSIVQDVTLPDGVRMVLRHWPHDTLRGATHSWSNQGVRTHLIFDDDTNLTVCQLHPIDKTSHAPSTLPAGGANLPTPAIPSPPSDTTTCNAYFTTRDGHLVPTHAYFRHLRAMRDAPLGRNMSTQNGFDDNTEALINNGNNEGRNDCTNNKSRKDGADNDATNDKDMNEGGNDGANNANNEGHDDGTDEDTKDHEKTEGGGVPGVTMTRKEQVACIKFFQDMLSSPHNDDDENSSSTSSSSSLSRSNGSGDDHSSSTSSSSSSRSTASGDDDDDDTDSDDSGDWDGSGQIIAGFFVRSSSRWD